MKIFFTILCIFSIGSMTWGDVSLTIYESDNVTLFDFRDILVGTTLKCRVSSDTSNTWIGTVLLQETDSELGCLSDAEPLPAAGDNSSAYFWEDGSSSGFDLYADSNPIVGDWFTLTYTALAEGYPSIGLYNYDTNFQKEWVDTKTFHQITPEPTSSLLIGFGSLISLYFRRKSHRLS
jgi:hypothetical protein